MKPLSAILFTLLFAIGQMGISFSAHHCMGKTSVSVFDVNFNKTCACDDTVVMPEGDDCCGNEYFTLKANTDTPTLYQASNLANSHEGFVAILFFQSQNILNVSGNAQQYPVIKAHPNIGVPLIVLNSNFRI